MTFATTRARDAWATIRGYVYQVDTTILRWIHLEPDARLELECGEDIDRVVSALEAESERELEQIKVREEGLSLRSAEALEAIANAAEHDASNPDQKLRFKFTTTARLAREHDHPDAAQAPGLALWEQVREASDPRDAALATLVTLLRSARRPRSTPATTWDCAARVFTDEARILDLVRRFEWGLLQTPPAEMREQVTTALMSTCHASSREDAQAMYEELFAFVFHMLGQRGSKQLTAAMLSREARGASDRVTGERVRARLETLSIRTAALQKRVDAIDERVATAYGLPGAAIGLGAVELDVEPPPTTLTLAPRTRLVGDVAATAHPWLAIEGEAGIGKSHLAVLVLRSLARAPVWVRLGPISANEAATRVVRTLSAWAKVASLDTAVVVAAAAEAAGNTTTFCFDDVPHIPKDHALRTILVKLSQLMEGAVRIITTSSQPIAWQVAEAVRCVTVTCTPFSTDEAAALFCAFGGSEFVKQHEDGFARLVEFAQGHPTLLSAMASFLRGREWRWDVKTFEGIWRGVYTEGTHSNTRAALEATVPNADVRELLYRLKLHFGSFGLDVVHALGGAEPALARAAEAFASVTGTWVQRVSDVRWRLSPLLTALPKTLQPEVARRCNLALANELLRKPLNQHTATSVVIHLMLADAHDRAAFILATALMSMAEHDKKVESDALLLWWGQPLPDTMTVGTRIRLRHAQIVAGQCYAKDTTFASKDLEALLARATGADAWAVLSVEVARFGDDFAARPGGGAAAFARIRNWADRVKAPNGERIELPDLTPLVWHLSATLGSRAHVDAWLEMLESLRPEERSLTDVVRSVCRGACDEVWLSECRRPPADARWGESFDTLRAIITSARRMDFPYLEACATTTTMMVLGEHTNAIAEAIALGEALLSSHPNNTDVAMLAHEALGRSQLLSGHGDQALPHLRLALADARRLEPLYACMTANLATRAAALAGKPTEARALAEQAVEIAATSSNHLPLAERIRTLGERALAEWHDGDTKASLRTILLAADHFDDFDAKPLRGVRREFTQAAVSLGENADALAAGKGSPVPPPPRGFFYGARWREGGIEWRDDFPTWLSFRFCRLAESVGDDRRARKWAVRGLEYGGGGAQHGISLVMHVAMMPYVLLSERDDAALALANHMATMAAEARAHPPAHEPEDASFERPSGPLVLWGALPLAIALATTAIDNREAAADLAASAAQILGGLAANSPVARTWREVASLIDAPYRGAACRDLAAQGTASFGQQADEGLRLLAYLQATATEDVPLVLAVRVHVDALPTIWRGGSRAIQRVVERYIDRFWTSAFRHEQFRFRMPNEVARSVEAIAARPPPERARRLLALMADGLGVPVPQHARDWMISEAV